MNYFIVYSTEDRELGIAGPISKEEAEIRLAEHYYGDLPIFTHLTYLSENGGSGYGNGMVIIKGEVVTPKPVEVVSKYKL